MITRENFEVFAADFLDGKLSPEDTLLFLAFLRENPDLKELLSEIDEFSLSPGNESFAAKDTLHKNFALKTKVTAANFEEFAIASSENLLTLQQEQNLELYLTQHPEKQQDLDLFRKVHLSPDLSIRFPSRKSLYRGRKKTLLYFRNAVAVAASFLLLAGLYLLLEKPFSYKQPEKETTIVQVPAAEIPAEEIRATTQPGISNQQEFIAQTARAGKTNGKLPVAQAKTTDKAKEEIVLKEVQPIPLRPVPYSYPSLGIQTVQTESKVQPSQNLLQKSSKEYLSLPELAAVEIRKRIKPASATDKSPITLLDIAEAGINGLGKLTGAKIRLDKKYDPDGKLIAVDFETPVFALSAPVKKNN